MFNNELNTSAQMIFTVHDINLMVARECFRKETDLVVHKDEEGVYVYSLAILLQGVRRYDRCYGKILGKVRLELYRSRLINSLLSKGDMRGMMSIPNKLPKFWIITKFALSAEGNEEYEYLNRLKEFKSVERAI